MAWALTDSQRRGLDADGYTVIEGAMSPALLATLRQRIDELFAAEGKRAGAEFKQEPGCRRLANLADKDPLFRELVQWPVLLDGARHVLGPEFKLSSVNVRSVDPQSAVRQPLHADMGAVPDAAGFSVFNSVWLVDDFTAGNGATRVVPGSHRWGRLPQEVLADPLAPHPDEVLLTGAAGSVVLMNAHAWHGGTANHTDRPRTALHIFFVRRDIPQQQYQKMLLRPEVQASLSPELRWLLALDDPLNDRLSSEQPGRSGFLK